MCSAVVLDQRRELQSSGSYFKASSKREQFGLQSMQSPAREVDDVPNALRLLGTHVPVIRQIMEVADTTNKNIVEVTRELGLPSSERVARALCLAHQMDYFPRKCVDEVNAPKLKEMIPKGVKEGRLTGLPCALNGSELLVVTSDPNYIQGIKRQYYDYQLYIQYCLASQSTIETLYRKKFQDTEKPFDEEINKPNEDQLNATRIMECLLLHAAAVGASDIHLEPRLTHGAIILRIDGQRETFRILNLRRSSYTNTALGSPEGPFALIINALFQQSGQADIKATGEGVMDQMIPPGLANRYGFRLHFSRTIYGLRAVIRLIEESGDAGELQDLDIDGETESKMRAIANSDSGMLVFTGPTGSGKSTSQAALLKTVDAVSKSVQTIENPVEIKAGMWVQHPLIHREGAGDEAALQEELMVGLLRCDPDIELMGEIRNADNAMLAVNMANTGHLVLSTLHANTASRAVIRLNSMRSERTAEKLDMTAVAAVLKGIMAQRLVRKLCLQCRVQDDRRSTQNELEQHNHSAESAYRANPEGCEACRFTGYSGRRLVYELMVMNNRASELIADRNTSFQELNDLIPVDTRMRARGLKLVSQGVTSIDEVRQAVPED